MVFFPKKNQHLHEILHGTWRGWQPSENSGVRPIQNYIWFDTCRWSITCWMTKWINSFAKWEREPTFVEGYIAPWIGHKLSFNFTTAPMRHALLSPFYSLRKVRNRKISKLLRVIEQSQNFNPCLSKVVSSYSSILQYISDCHLCYSQGSARFYKKAK